MEGTCLPQGHGNFFGAPAVLGFSNVILGVWKGSDSQEGKSLRSSTKVSRGRGGAAPRRPPTQTQSASPFCGSITYPHLPPTCTP